MFDDIRTEMARRSRPERASLTAEMHSRKLPPFSAPARLMQIMLLADDAELDAAAAHFGADGAKHAILDLGGATLVWERHSEFTTYSFIIPGAFDAPFDETAFAPFVAQWLDRMPGEIIRSSFLAIARTGDPARLPEHLEQWFHANDLVVCDVHDGMARIWSDFRLHGGFGRMFVAVRDDDPRRIPALAQSLLELGNYRKLALLGLPEAQRHGPELRQIEQSLAHLSGDIDRATRPREELLHAIGELGSRLAQITASTRYRMSATAAYAAICDDRVGSLAVSAVGGGQTLVGFTQRRLHPAVQTCASFVQRLDDLAGRVTWTAELLRTRIDTEIAAQNRDLLASLDRRNAMQLRLQQTVEGLSVAAISYYAVSLVGYLAKASHAAWHWPDYELATGVSVPFVIAFVAWTTHRLRKVHGDHDGHG
ncbi:putative membrane-anchored protein [Novosphingobium sp. PhB165]|uniref:DUF3422 family protein n=1 Tax=Novosphingobium sp. PhB165 TaxID=2485105 RepID=UPI0010DF32C1|nr:DUF3422 domain-containing protein [Novosphingobium sp. PhB165]TCM21455.1 putative membrane-anchored protein [Novosphingobium sp. PhB165]